MGVLVHIMLEWSAATETQHAEQRARDGTLWASQARARREASARPEAREQLLEAKRLANVRGFVLRRLNRLDTCDGYE
jgi:hypothetical protein